VISDLQLSMTKEFVEMQMSDIFKLNLKEVELPQIEKGVCKQIGIKCGAANMSLCLYTAGCKITEQSYEISKVKRGGSLPK
jgi:hypothetical protein